MTPGVTLNQSVDERIKEFRSDPQKMDITTKFVNDVVEEAKDEVMKRMKERDRIEALNSGSESTRKRGRWHSRARGFFSRLFASFCFCSPETKTPDSMEGPQKGLRGLLKKGPKMIEDVNAKHTQQQDV